MSSRISHPASGSPGTATTETGAAEAAGSRAAAHSGAAGILRSHAKGAPLAAGGSGPPQSPERSCNPAKVAPRLPLALSLGRAFDACDFSYRAVDALFAQARGQTALDVAPAQETVDRVLSCLQDEDEGQALSGLVRLKAHEDYACMHSVAVCALMGALGRQLGFGADEMRRAALSGLLHDIGKAFVPERILRKPTLLSDDERRIVQTHARLGQQAILLAEGDTAMAADVALHHHERFDGRGYPDRLAGEEIALLARMGAVCDVYDAVTSNRPYRDGWDPAFAMDRMAAWGAAGQFDPTVLSAFRTLMGEHPLGSLVRLRSQRLAVVNAHRSGDARRPSVTVFFCSRTRCFLTPEVIDLSAPGCEDGLEAAESNARWRFTDLDTLWAGEFAEGVCRFVPPSALGAGIRC